MHAREKMLALTALMVGPATAFAAEGSPGGTVLFAFVGGFAGGALGALFACWLCKRRRESQNEGDPRR